MISPITVFTPIQFIVLKRESRASSADDQNPFPFFISFIEKTEITNIIMDVIKNLKARSNRRQTATPAGAARTNLDGLIPCDRKTKSLKLLIRVAAKSMC